MRGTAQQNLERRFGIFHLRVRVPDDIRSLVGLTEVRRSLRTYQPSRARTLAAVYAARVYEVFEMIRNVEPTKDQVRGLLARFFDDMARDIEAGGVSRVSDWERNEQLYCSTEMTAMLRTQRATSTYDREVQSIAQMAIATANLKLDELSSDRRDDVLDGAARLLIERERLRQLRLSDRLAPFVPQDPIFATANVPQLSHEAQAIGPTLGDAIDVYLNAKARSWTRKTHKIRTRYLGYLRQHLGDDRSLGSIGPADIRGFRDAITRLRKNNGRAVKQTFAQKQTESATRRIGDSTVVLIFVPTKAFFSWCVSEQNYIERSPVENIKVSVAKRVKGKRTRRPFTAEEIAILFSAPIFTGCQSVKRRFMRGDRIIRDAHYWIPILGYYTGARMGEIVQLHLNDMGVEDDIHFIEVTEDGAGHPDGANTKHVKTEAGVRRIPLHPDLVSLGFLQFVTERRRKRGTPRLFPEIKFGADRQASTIFSKWFGRLMSKTGLDDPALVFHSLRHNAEDAFRDALQPQFVTDKIIGHSDGSTSAGYGRGATLAVCHQAVCAMKLEVRLPALWASNSPASDVPLPSSIPSKSEAAA